MDRVAKRAVGVASSAPVRHGEPGCGLLRRAELLCCPCILEAVEQQHAADEVFLRCRQAGGREGDCAQPRGLGRQGCRGQEGKCGRRMPVHWNHLNSRFRLRVRGLVFEAVRCSQSGSGARSASPCRESALPRGDLLRSAGRAYLRPNQRDRDLCCRALDGSRGCIASRSFARATTRSLKSTRSTTSPISDLGDASGAVGRVRPRHDYSLESVPASQ